MSQLQLRLRSPATLQCQQRRAARSTALLIALLAVGVGCKSLSYPDVEPEPEPGPEVHVFGDATPVPTRDARVWTELARAGREELRSGNLQAAESRFRAALAATNELPAHDARARAALTNLLHLGETYQQRKLYDDAARITSLVVDESGAGRGPDFDSAARLLLRQGAYFEESDRSLEAAPLYACALGLDGAGPHAGSDYFWLRLAAARLELGEGRFETAAVDLARLLGEIDANSVDARIATRLTLAVAEAGRGEITAAEGELRMAREEAEAAGPAAVETLDTGLAELVGWLRESGLPDEANRLESIAALP
jgi:tetratricopeptide (TPR) repeat protein